MPDPSRSGRSFWPLLLGIVLVFAALRWPMLNVPMERDEGEYATIGLGIYHGIPPYREAYTMKMPGAAALHAVIFWCLGPSVRAIHLALLAVNAVTIILVALMGRRLIASTAGLIAGAAFGTLTIGTGVFGYWLSAEHFAVFFLSAGACITLFGVGRRRSWVTLGALLLGCSIVVKHHAAFPALAWLGVGIWRIRSSRLTGSRIAKLCQTGGLVLAFLAPVILTTALMAACGVLEAYYFWTWDYARQYIAGVPWSVGWQYLRIGLGGVVVDAPLLWLLAVLGLGVLTARASLVPWGPEARSWLLPVFLASVLSVSAGLMFRGQYFILLAPVAALLSAVAWETIARCPLPSKWTRLNASVLRVPLSVVVLVAAFFALAGPILLACCKTPEQVCRLVYGLHPFPESPAVAKYLQQHTRPDEKIAVLGSEPQIYFLSDRRPALPYLCAYEMMKPHGFASVMQREAIRCIETARPRYLVFPDYPTSWGIFPQADPTFMQWLKGFIQQYYQLDGVVDLIAEDRTVIRWGDDARAYPVESSQRLYVFLRKEPSSTTRKAPPAWEPDRPAGIDPFRKPTAVSRPEKKRK